jgi:hypothetical protein
MKGVFIMGKKIVAIKFFCRSIVFLLMFFTNGAAFDFGSIFGGNDSTSKATDNKQTSSNGSRSQRSSGSASLAEKTPPKSASRQAMEGAGIDLFKGAAQIGMGAANRAIEGAQARKEKEKDLQAELEAKKRIAEAEKQAMLEQAALRRQIAQQDAVFQQELADKAARAANKKAVAEASASKTVQEDVAKLGAMADGMMTRRSGSVRSQVPQQQPTQRLSQKQTSLKNVNSKQLLSAPIDNSDEEGSIISDVEKNVSEEEEDVEDGMQPENIQQEGDSLIGDAVVEE